MAHSAERYIRASSGSTLTELQSPPFDANPLFPCVARPVAGSSTLLSLGFGYPLTLGLCGSAVAQAGKSVLHLDPAAHYGTHWAGLRLDQFLEWAHSLQKKGQSEAAVNGQSEAAVNGQPDSGTANMDSSAQCAIPPCLHSWTGND